ncbi:MAG: hypothetical protein Q9159_001078 [Coniocarpon cinnabarinum]
MAASAFTTVSSRTRLGGVAASNASTPPPSQQQSSDPKPGIDWPPAVKLYVQRSFADENYVEGLPKDEVINKMKDLINASVKNHTLYTLDWETYPLPQHFILQERMGANAPAPLASQPPQNFADIRISKSNELTNSPKKRKSSDVEDESSLPPWRSSDKSSALENRLTFPDSEPSKKQEKRQRKFREDTGSLNESSKSTEYLEKRRQRFQKDAPARREPTPPLDIATGPIVGTSEKLEKRYLRLTAPPKPETVRPLPVLRRTFDLLREKWRGDHDYNYICDQFKSLRQDLTVQHIKNDFLVKVYETHARIALEMGDIGEYNQCQTQLRALYKQSLGGHPAEFLAYRILYFIYTCNPTDMNRVLADVTPSDREQPAVEHALQARSALALNNYHRFFKLYADPPNMGGYLMDMFVDRERLAALASLCRGFKPDLSLQYVTEELAFKDEQACAQFICEHGGEQLFEQKESGIRFLVAKAGQIFEKAKGAAFRTVDIKGQL